MACIAEFIKRVGEYKMQGFSEHFIDPPPPHTHTHNDFNKFSNIGVRMQASMNHMIFNLRFMHQKVKILQLKNVTFYGRQHITL